VHLKCTIEYVVTEEYIHATISTVERVTQPGIHKILHLLLGNHDLLLLHSPTSSQTIVDMLPVILYQFSVSKI
jgi:hypothetical protein